MAASRKLTADQVREARRALDTARNTPSLLELAKRWGVSRQTVLLAAQRRNYREVPDLV